MKTTRHYAINVLLANLSTLALGNLDEATLEIALTNIEALRKVADDFEALKKELFKRIYGDVDKMSEDERKNLQDFFDMLGKIKDETDAIKSAYPSLYAMREKEIKVIVSLLNKEIEVDIEPMERKTFTKGILLGNKDAKAIEIERVFAPMFRTEESEAKADFSELDNLI